MGRQDFLNACYGTIFEGLLAHLFPFFIITPVAKVRIPEFGLVIFSSVRLSQVVSVRANVVNRFNSQGIFINLDTAGDAT